MDRIGAFLIIRDLFHDCGQSLVPHGVQKDSGWLASRSPIRVSRFGDLHFNPFEHDDAGRGLSWRDISRALCNRLSLPASGIKRLSDIFHQGNSFGIKLDREIERSATKFLEGTGNPLLGCGAEPPRAIGPIFQSDADQDESGKRDRQSSLPGAFRNPENQKSDLAAQPYQKQDLPDLLQPTEEDQGKGGGI
ncbi:hypothetical protein AAFX91_33505 [Bradyrhizobium sp. 31Argb]|uniref:hypothetical protein n=1 Tax=Bradyrhizobium sp. 31Argb TaxID=3141247 RepID=UPI0037483ECA